MLAFVTDVEWRDLTFYQLVCRLLRMYLLSWIGNVAFLSIRTRCSTKQIGTFFYSTMIAIIWWTVCEVHINYCGYIATAANTYSRRWAGRRLFVRGLKKKKKRYSRKKPVVNKRLNEFKKICFSFSRMQRH